VEGVVAARRDHWEELLRIDHEVTATDRRKLLLRLFEERPAAVRVAMLAGRGEGFLTVRPGSRALQIGPCLASAAGGPLLLQDAWHRYAGQSVFIDIPAGDAKAIQLAEAQGLTVQRRLVRMGKGEPVREQIKELWASSGPEKG
jgi:hypothetical protein